MKRFGEWPIRGQLRLLVAVLALPYAGLMLFQAWQAEAARRADAAARLDMLAQGAAAGTAQFMRETKELLARLAARPDVRAMGRQGCDPVFATFSVQNRDYANLLLVDEAGWVRCSAMELNPGQQASVAPLIGSMRPSDALGLLIGLPSIGPISGRWVVPVVHPVRDASGALLGYIGLSVELDRMSAFRAQIPADSGAAGIFLAAADGLVLAAGAGAGVKPGTQQDAVLVARLGAAGARGGQLTDGVGRAGPPLAGARVEGTGWVAVAVGRPAQPLSIAPESLAFGAAVAGTLLVALLLARALAKACAAPVLRLAETAAAIADGGAPSRMPTDGTAEAAAAGQALNRMLDAFDAALDGARRGKWELRAMLDSIDEVVYAQAADGSAMHYLSPAAEALYGGDVRHFAAAPRLRHASVLEKDRPRLDALAGQLQQAGRGEAEYRIRRGDGQVRWLRERCRLVFDADGTPLLQVGIVSDVTMFRELIEGLRQSEARFRSLADLSSDWYWEQDAEFRFVELTGVPSTFAVSRRSAFLGKCRWEVDTVGLEQAEWAAHRARLARHEAFRDLEYGVRLDSGDIFYMAISGEPMFDGSGRFTGYRGVGSDITARKRMEQALKASEARLMLALDATSEGVWDYDVEAGDTYFSQHFAELLGCGNQAELKARFTFAEALHPDDRQRALAAQARLLREGERFDEVYRLRRADGVYRWFHGRGIAACGDDGRPVRFVGAIADVTAQKASETQLRTLSTAVEQSPVSILITDTRGDIEYVNPRFCQTTGYSPDEVRGRNPRILKSGETTGEVYQALWQTIIAGQEWSGELHNRKKNGELFWEFVRIIPLLSEGGEVMNFMAVKEDITLHKELTAREQLRQEQLLHHARLAAMGEMAAALAHELNQPLAAIANFGGVVEHQLAAPQPDLAQAREVVRTIAGQALRAGEIVWRVREFSRKQESRREPADINALLRDVVRLADIAAESREVIYEYDLARGLPPVPVDRVQIEQVLLNLIRNGVEAMEAVPGEKRLTLTSRLAEGGAAVQLSVRDRGCGLPDRIAVDLFTPFFTTKPEGMGMGLSISRSIVEAHGGRLWARPARRAARLSISPCRSEKRTSDEAA